jgi:hypothetical protein
MSNLACFTTTIHLNDFFQIKPQWWFLFVSILTLNCIFFLIQRNANRMEHYRIVARVAIRFNMCQVGQLVPSFWILTWSWEEFVKHMKLPPHERKATYETHKRYWNFEQKKINQKHIFIRDYIFKKFGISPLGQELLKKCEKSFADESLKKMHKHNKKWYNYIFARSAVFKSPLQLLNRLNRKMKERWERQWEDVRLLFLNPFNHPRASQNINPASTQIKKRRGLFAKQQRRQR